MGSANFMGRKELVTENAKFSSSGVNCEMEKVESKVNFAHARYRMKYSLWIQLYGKGQDIVI